MEASVVGLSFDQKVETITGVAGDGCVKGIIGRVDVIDRKSVV